VAGRQVEALVVDRVEVGRVFPADSGPAIGLVLHQADRPGTLTVMLADDVAFACAELIVTALGLVSARDSDEEEGHPDA
jgi:hypothetical protein